MFKRRFAAGVGLLLIFAASCHDGAISLTVVNETSYYVDVATAPLDASTEYYHGRRAEYLKSLMVGDISADRTCGICGLAPNETRRTFESGTPRERFIVVAMASLGGGNVAAGEVIFSEVVSGSQVVIQIVDQRQGQ